MDAEQLNNLIRSSEHRSWYLEETVWVRYRGGFGFVTMHINGVEIIPVWGKLIHRCPSLRLKRTLLLGYTRISEGVYYKP